MQQHYDSIRELLRAVRRRWRALRICEASTRAALSASVALAAGLVAAAAVGRSPLALAAIGVCTFLFVFGALVWALAPLRRIPTDVRVARFIEERAPGLDDRLVSAVDAFTSEQYSESPLIAESMMSDAANHARAVDPDDVLPSRTVRRAGIQAAAAALLLIAVAFAGRNRVGQAVDALSLAWFPSHVRLEVTPGNARIKADSPMTIEARLVGNRAPVAAQLQVGDGDSWRAMDMNAGRDGRFALVIPSVKAPFTYKVTAGPVASATYSVAVARPPRVTRIDVEYTFPQGLNLPPHTEEDSGDIYAPAGTAVRVKIHTDRPVASGHLALAAGKRLPLQSDGATLVTEPMKIVEDDSYRIALTDREGLATAGDTEYFIRTLEDRPPEVRILKPASDRSVTRLEEVDIEAQADDDFGIDRMDLIYAVGGGPEQKLPFKVPKQKTSVTGTHTLYLEDLNVQPGDLVSYYVRARDLTRGKRASEAKSDIFFLEVKPFDQEFSLAQSQAMANGAGGNRSIDDLVTAQKEIVVATWKLDRRAQNAKGQSEQDVRAVARAEAELKTRVEQTSSTFRESTMRDPRRRTQGRTSEPQPSATDALPEEDDMGAAAAAMQTAVTHLDALKTSAALPPEMDALKRLLKAQSDVRKRQVARQQAGAGAGQNNRNYDLSTLFDKELQRQQQTNYETPNSTEQREDSNTGVLDKVKELARRQDELIKRQQELAKERAGMTEEELKRELEKLTREQTELRQRAEEIARQMEGRQQQGSRQSANQQSSSQGQQSGSQASSGQQSGRQQSAGQQPSGQPSRSANGMRSASDDMRDATNDLRRQDPSQASARGTRALEKLRDLERQLQAGAPDERRRALGEMQLEARQLADGQRQVASELEKRAPGESGQDQLRRLAGEQERLADRARRLEQGLKQSDSGSAGANGASRDAKAAAAAAARELDRQRLAERMQQSAEQLRAAAGAQKTDGSGSQDGQKRSGDQPPSAASTDPRAEAGAQQDIARSLDRIADALASANGSRDGESKKLSDQLARAQELRDRLNSITRELKESADRQSGKSTLQPSGNPNGQPSARSEQKAAGETGQPSKGESGGASGGNDLARLREEYARQLKQTRDLLDELRREDPTSQHGAGFTYEGQGMVLSAPGTEAFKQDFAKWDDLRKQATQALDNAQLSLSQKLQAKEARDRLAAGGGDRAPAEYQKQVDSYFKAIASKKKPGS